MSEAYEGLMAKTDPEDDTLWLPLWMHLKDTAGVMKRLVHEWVPMSVVQATGLNYEEFEKTAVFVAGVHDIGKATSYFQSIITMRSEKKDELRDQGFEILQRTSFTVSTPHSFAGQYILLSKEVGIGVNRSVADVVGAHHGIPADKPVNHFDDSDPVQENQRNYFGCQGSSHGKEIWMNAWRKIVDDALSESGIRSVQELPKLTMEAQVLLSGLLIVADWIASNTACFPLISIDEKGSRDLYPLRVDRGFGDLSFPGGWISNTVCIEDSDFKERFGFLPNAVQREMIQAVESCDRPGIFILEAQMGVGKTEAALSAAELLANRCETGGIFFGLPTQATSNGLFGRLYDWAESVSQDTVNAIQLAHGAAEMNEEYEKLMVKGRSLVDNVDSEDGGVNVHPWFQGNKRALLANFVIGTVDQFLMASLKRKHFMLRHLGLAGKVVIIDECHAYDTYMNVYLDRTLQWMAAYGVPVILLSATLPAKRRSKLINCYAKAYSKYYLGKENAEIKEVNPAWKDSQAYPLLTWTDGEKICQKEIEREGAGREVRLETLGSEDEVVDLLNRDLEEGGCACIILNTVKAAQDMYRKVSEGLKNATVLLYHAQFTMPDRAEKERELLKHMGKSSDAADRNRFVLIGTQVLEQSLDYDADIMISQLCPADLLLQRMGRLHRHKGHDSIRPATLQTPRFLVLTEEGEPFGKGTEAVYGAYLLLRTWQGIQGRDHVVLPDDIPVLVQSVYRESEGEPEDRTTAEAHRKYDEIQKEKKGRAKNYLMRLPIKEETIEGMLVDKDPDESMEMDAAAECSVRDGTASLDVLLMKRDGSGAITFVDDDKGEFKLDAGTMPENREGKAIARQKIRLPHVFSQRWNEHRTIEELEALNREELSAWQSSPWIKGELVLLLDSDGHAELSGYQLAYDRELGLQYEKKEETDAGERI